MYSTTSKNLNHFAMSDTKGYLELSGFSVSSFSDLVQLIIISSNRFSLASKSARSGIKSKRCMHEQAPHNSPEYH